MSLAPYRDRFNSEALDNTYVKAAEFSITADYQEWFVNYLSEVGFSNSGRPMTESSKKLWRNSEQGYRTDDNRLIIRSSDFVSGVGVTIPNFMNITNNFQIYWNQYALIGASSNINVLSFDHFQELVTYPSRDYHEPLKANEVFAPAAFN